MTAGHVPGHLQGTMIGHPAAWSHASTAAPLSLSPDAGGLSLNSREAPSAARVAARNAELGKLA